MDPLEEEIKRRTCALWRLFAFEGSDYSQGCDDSDDDDHDRSTLESRVRYDEDQRSN